MKSILFDGKEHQEKTVLLKKIGIIMLKLAKLSLLQEYNYSLQSDYSDCFGLNKIDLFLA